MSDARVAFFVWFSSKIQKLSKKERKKGSKNYKIANTQLSANFVIWS